MKVYTLMISGDFRMHNIISVDDAVMDNTSLRIIHSFRLTQLISLTFVSVLPSISKQRTQPVWPCSTASKSGLPLEIWKEANGWAHACIYICLEDISYLFILSWGTIDYLHLLRISIWCLLQLPHQADISLYWYVRAWQLSEGESPLSAGKHFISHIT